MYADMVQDVFFSFSLEGFLAALNSDIYFMHYSMVIWLGGGEMAAWEKNEK